MVLPVTMLPHLGFVEEAAGLAAASVMLLLGIALLLLAPRRAARPIQRPPGPRA